MSRRLTLHYLCTYSCLKMRASRAIGVVVLVAALAAYSTDCFAASTPDEAMQCCDSMPCPQQAHHGSEDCCRNMPSLHAPFVQPHAVDTAFHAPVVLAALPATTALQGLVFSANILLAVQSHSPPSAPAAASMPLRV